MITNITRTRETILVRHTKMNKKTLWLCYVVFSFSQFVILPFFRYFTEFEACIPREEMIKHEVSMWFNSNNIIFIDNI